MKNFNIRTYLCDKIVELIVFITALGTMLGFCVVFELRAEIMIIILAPVLLAGVGLLIYDFWRRKHFYQTLQLNLAGLDQAYLLSETLVRPGFLDGEIFHDVCYELNKSMLEQISRLTTNNQEFSDYIELWIHEVKSPLMTLALLAEKLDDPRLDRELRRLNELAEQVLYFVRAKNSAEDYLLKKYSLDQITKNVLLAYRDQIQLQDVTIRIDDLDQQVYTDGKWLQFILGQLLANALKYGATEIIIRVVSQQKHKILQIRDNGIGIPSEDLPRVFEKTFTGKNGHSKNGMRATGMGLYIVKTLCDKLGIKIAIHSKVGSESFTEVELFFREHDYYENVR